MTKIRYVVGVFHVVKRVHIEQSGKAVGTYIPDPHFGTHDTNIAAKRAWCLTMGEAQASASDEFVRRQFDAQYRNFGTFRVLKIKNGEVEQVTR